MMHKPINIINLSLSLPHKTCFEDFSTQIHYQNRIAIIGRNGGGKSSLLKILLNQFEPSSGDIFIPDDIKFGYVPQLVEGFQSLSGGQKFNAALTGVLSFQPNILLLDEPTNHLDRNNRKSLMKMLEFFQDTLIVVTHDIELLRTMDIIWHIDNGKVHIFNGNYDDYLRENNIKRLQLEKELAGLERQKQEIHKSLMNEQARVSKSKAKGEKAKNNNKWSPIIGNAKASSAQESSGRKKAQISDKKQDLNNRLSELYLPEVIKPKFNLTSDFVPGKTIISINNGSIAYNAQTIIQDINISLYSDEKIAIHGDNGSGKSTLLKAIMNKTDVRKQGEWNLPKPEDIGYLDQHYANLEGNETVLECLNDIVPSWNQAEIRKHLNDFLFRKNEEVNNLIANLSGGERARLSLALIAANPPKLLILDEITNNLDLETIEHITQVLKEYPGAIIVVSHDQDFLEKIGIDSYYDILNGKVRLR